MSIIDNLMGNEGNIKINDQVIANDSLAGLKGMSSGYLLGTLESSTPEVRRMLSEYLSQSVMSHEAMTALAMKKGWYKPYLNLEEQMSEVYKQSEWVLSPNA